MTSGKSKCHGFLLLVSIIKSISTKMLIKISHSFKKQTNLPNINLVLQSSQIVSLVQCDGASW